VSSEIVNYTVTGTRRLDINLAVSYGVDPELVMQILQKAAKQPEVLETPAPVIAMKEYNEQSITYGMMLWCNGADYWNLKFAVNLELSRLAKDAGIRFYDPQMKVIVEK
jgi:small conductance mechanosensitive channel